MPQYTELGHGSPFWVDLGSPDLDASKSFYNGLFGWRYEEAPPEEVGGIRYVWAENSSGFAAGIAENEKGGIKGDARASWGVQLLVDDAEEVAGRVADLGGTVVAAPEKVGEYGVLAEVADPTGGTVKIWEAYQSGPTIKHEHGSMQWCELMTPDPEAAAAFFRTLLKAKTEPKEMPDGSVNSIVHTADGPVMGISSSGGLREDLQKRLGGAAWVVYFNVDDVDAATERAVARGGELPDPPWDVPGIGRIAWIVDPQGALVGLIKPLGG